MLRLARVKPAIRSFLNLNSLYPLPQLRIGNRPFKNDMTHLPLVCFWVEEEFLFPWGETISLTEPMSSCNRPGGSGELSNHCTLSSRLASSISICRVSSTLKVSVCCEPMVCLKCFDEVLELYGVQVLYLCFYYLTILGNYFLYVIVWSIECRFISLQMIVKDLYSGLFGLVMSTI